MEDSDLMRIFFFTHNTDAGHIHAHSHIYIYEHIHTYFTPMNTFEKLR